VGAIAKSRPGTKPFPTNRAEHLQRGARELPEALRMFGFSAHAAEVVDGNLDNAHALAVGLTDHLRREGGAGFAAAGAQGGPGFAAHGAIGASDIGESRLVREIPQSLKNLGHGDVGPAHHKSHVRALLHHLACRARAEDERRCVDVGQELGEVERAKRAVGLGEHNHISVRLIESTSAGEPVAGVLLAHDARTMRPRDVARAVARAVVDDDDLFHKRTRAKVVDDVCDRGRLVVRGDDDGDAEARAQGGRRE